MQKNSASDIPRKSKSFLLCFLKQVRVVCPGVLGLLKEPAQALQTQESTYAAYSAGSCQPGMPDYCLTLSYYRISQSHPQYTHELINHSNSSIDLVS